MKKIFYFSFPFACLKNRFSEKKIKWRKREKFLIGKYNLITYRNSYIKWNDKWCKGNFHLIHSWKLFVSWIFNYVNSRWKTEFIFSYLYGILSTSSNICVIDKKHDAWGNKKRVEASGILNKTHLFIGSVRAIKFSITSPFRSDAMIFRTLELFGCVTDSWRTRDFVWIITAIIVSVAHPSLLYAFSISARKLVRPTSVI